MAENAKSSYSARPMFASWARADVGKSVSIQRFFLSMISESGLFNSARARCLAGSTPARARVLEGAIIPIWASASSFVKRLMEGISR
jgi:hypothetical protein